MIKEIVMGGVIAFAPGCQFRPDTETYRYDSLQGRPVQKIVDPEDQFFYSIEDFRAHNRSPRPLSVVLRSNPGEMLLQIAYGDGWVPGAFVVVQSGNIDGNNTCVVESPERLAAYDELHGRFVRYQAANRELVQRLTEGANQPCDSFLDKQ